MSVPIHVGGTSAAVRLLAALLGVVLAAMNACGEAQRQGRESDQGPRAAHDTAAYVFGIQSLRNAR